MLTANDTKILAFLEAWKENMQNALKANNLACETNMQNATPYAVAGSKYIRLDKGGSGHFMVDMTTEVVYSIKGYGVPNKKKPRGTIEFLTNFIKAETAAGRDYTRNYWYKLHPTQ